MRTIVTKEEAKKIYLEENSEYILIEDEGWNDYDNRYSCGSKIFKMFDNTYWLISCLKFGSHYKAGTVLQQVENVVVEKKEWRCVK